MKVQKNIRGDWEAVTRMELGTANRVLEIRTGKGMRCLYTNARVYTLDGGFMSTDLFGDFNKRLATDNGARCTEKSVRAQHEQALTVASVTLREAVAFYAGKDVFTPEAIAHMDGTPTIDAASKEYHGRVALEGFADPMHY